jgi:hypothetical protein
LGCFSQDLGLTNNNHDVLKALKVLEMLDGSSFPLILKKIKVERGNIISKINKN